MQFIKKQNIEPANWDSWFTVPPSRRTYDYGVDSSSLSNLRLVKEYLINEQNCLCAYCQQKIGIDNSSIEHVTPKEHNKELSTSYFNLVAVCNRNQVKDPLTGKYHCDRARGSKLVPPIIFYSKSNSTIKNINPFFSAYSNGEIVAKHSLESDIKNQINAFINILNLNQTLVKESRSKDVLGGITSAYAAIPKSSPDKAIFWKAQYERILNNKSHPFREFLLVFIGSKIGLS